MTYTLLMLPDGEIQESFSDPNISSVSIHITLMMPKAQASKTPKIHAKYHIKNLQFSSLGFAEGTTGKLLIFLTENYECQ